MNQSSAIQNAYEKGRLWPTLHAAVDVYLRRSARGADSYERIWRLIHVWESIAITVAGVVATRLKEIGDSEEDYLTVRAKTYGTRWNALTSTLETDSASCFSGSIDKWIELLRYVSDLTTHEDPVVKAVSAFLKSASVDQRALVAAWGRACEVTPGVEGTKVAVRDAIRAMNQFRNRFAHVPFPYDPLPDVAAAVLSCTEDLFRADQEQAVGPLRGCILFVNQTAGSRLLQGGAHVAVPAEHLSKLSAPEGEQFFFVHGYDRKTPPSAVWPSWGFAHVDDMLRAYALTRVHGDDFSDLEYTRYLAEANAVLVLDRETFPKAWPRPTEQEYRVGEVPPPSPSPSTSAPDLAMPTPMDRATIALREGEFDMAIEELSAMVKTRPGYHVAWLKLASAYREKAVRAFRLDADGVAAHALLEQSIHAAVTASAHVEATYRAEAHYQASKSRWRLFQIDQDPKQRVLAEEDAERAAEMSSEERFASWRDRLRREQWRPPAAPPPALPPD